jgi:hypothetical protein
MKYLDCTPSLQHTKNKKRRSFLFDQHLIETELSENRQWKLIIENQIACVWAITFNDAEIWEERDCNDAIYIHRIATHSDFRGHNFVKIIVDWAKEYAKSIGKDYIRLDTLGNKLNITQIQFDFLGLFDLNPLQDYLYTIKQLKVVACSK